jgi:hypothetical protein
VVEPQARFDQVNYWQITSRPAGGANLMSVHGDEPQYPTVAPVWKLNTAVDDAGLTPAHHDPALSCQEPMGGADDRVRADDVTLGIDTQGRGG